MAGAGAKKRVDENKQKVETLRIIAAVGVCTYLLVRLLYFGGIRSWWHLFGFAMTSAVSWFTFTNIAAFAAPTYGPQGELLDGGADLSMKGMCAYCHDLLYITAFVQVGASFSSWFWYVYYLVPMYGLYKLTELVIIPWWRSAYASNEAGDDMDPAARKKQERAQKRAQSRAQKWR